VSPLPLPPGSIASRSKTISLNALSTEFAALAYVSQAVPEPQLPMSPERWKTIGVSQFAWEMEALAFLREKLPDRDPYRVWSNFEFIADDGSINEVDALIFTPMGLFIVEIKSRPGEVTGNDYTWTWRTNGKLHTQDSPLIGANWKARKLASLLKRQKHFGKVRLPFLEPVVFCSSSNVSLRLPPGSRRGVFDRSGIIDALMSRVGLLSDRVPDERMGQATAAALVKSMAALGIHKPQLSRRVGDFELERLLQESATGLYQDWVAHHVALPKTRRVVRVYPKADYLSSEEAQQAQRLCEREFSALQGLTQPGIALAESYTNSDLGPAIVFRLPPEAQRLDHYLAQRGNQLSVDVRLSFARQLAEALQYAHSRKVVHGALSPQSIYVLDPEAPVPVIQIFNWQLHRKGRHTGTRGGTHITATLHAEQLREDASIVYLAPEVQSGNAESEEAQDIFALGAVTWFLFTGQPPAATGLELLRTSESHGGLDLGTVMDAPADSLRTLIRSCTSPDRLGRPDSMSDFLHELNLVEAELTTPDEEARQNPLEAKPGDRLLGGLEVVERLGRGSTAVALLVRKDGEERVLKIANQPENNERIHAEFEALSRLQHPGIVRVHRLHEIPPRTGFLMDRAGTETLASRIRSDGRLHLDLLERFGIDLLEAVAELERNGIAHKDIKPENIGIRKRGKSDELHLVLFDFSLTAAPADNIRCGTPPYLDPFLVDRRRSRWDLSAERFSAAVTLHEMATGTLPRWGDGVSAPAAIPDEVSLDAERFDPALRERLTAFFQRALRRDAVLRFPSTGEMLDAWREAFAQADQPASGSEQPSVSARLELLKAASLQTQLVELGLSTRAANAMDRLNAITVADLLRVNPWSLNGLPGVGKKTIRELSELQSALRRLFPAPGTHTNVAPVEPDAPTPPGTLSLDQVLHQLRRAGGRTTGDSDRSLILCLLGLPSGIRQEPLSWPSQTEVALEAGLSRQRVSQAITGARKRWRKFSGITELRDVLAELLLVEGGAMTVDEVADALAATRGTSLPEADRRPTGLAVARALVEAESEEERPRFAESRSHGRVLLTRSPELAEYVFHLGSKADELARLDPLAPPARVIETLRSVPPPEGIAPLSDARLVRIAVRVSHDAALSSRMEVYPRGMDAARAVRLAAGALLGTADLSPEDVQQRVTSRYPDAAPVPPRPELERLLDDAGTRLRWDPAAADGRGAFRQERADRITLGSTAPVLRGTSTTLPAPSIDLDEGLLFDQRLQRALQQQSSLLLFTELEHYLDVRRRLAARFNARCIDLDSALLDALRLECKARNVQWQNVLTADEQGPSAPNWIKLQQLVAAALNRVRADLLATPGLLLLANVGLLGRYQRLDFLSQLLESVPSHSPRPDALWILVPSDRQKLLPTLHGEAVPIPPTGPCRVPETWLAKGLTGD
jgi:serine/threonine protein kinase